MHYRQPTRKEIQIAQQYESLRKAYTKSECATFLNMTESELSGIIFRYNRYVFLKMEGKSLDKSSKEFPDLRNYEPKIASFTEIVNALRGVKNEQEKKIVNSLNPDHFVKAEELFPFLKKGIRSKV